jgi:Arc/MetJ-type ribon-helix-helix transcriptional regulator
MMKRRVIFRLSDKMFRQIQEAIEQGKAKTASDIVRDALSEYLSEGV